MLNDFDIKKILDQKLNRKDFLRYVGVLLLSVFGVSNLLSSLTKNSKAVQPQADTKLKNGFGGGKYGA